MALAILITFVEWLRLISTILVNDVITERAQYAQFPHRANKESPLTKAASRSLTYDQYIRLQAKTKRLSLPGYVLDQHGLRAGRASFYLHTATYTNHILTVLEVRGCSTLLLVCH